MLFYDNTQPLFSINASSSALTFNWSIKAGQSFFKDQWARFQVAWLQDSSWRVPAPFDNQAAEQGNARRQQSRIDGHKSIHPIAGTQLAETILTNVTSRNNDAHNNDEDDLKNSTSSQEDGGVKDAEDDKDNRIQMLNGAFKKNVINKKGISNDVLQNMTTSIKHKSLLSDDLPPCPPVPPQLGQFQIYFVFYKEDCQYFGRNILL